MATVTRYVNTASSAGGDGTTNGTAGATRAYATFLEWEAAEDTDLVTDGDVHIVNLDGAGGADSTASLTRISDWITGASNDITIQQNPSGTAYIRQSSHADGPMQLAEDYITLDGFTCETTSGTGFGIGLSYWTATSGDNKLTIKNMTVERPSGSTTSYDYALSSTNAVIDIYNSLGFSGGRAMDTRNSAAVTMSYCTFFQMTDQLGILSDTECVTKNTYCGKSSGSNNDWWATSSTGSHNVSSDTTATATFTDSHNSKAPTDQFVNIGAGTEDFHLKSGSFLEGEGTPVSGITTDFEGDARDGSTPDVGYDEFVAVGGAGNPWNYYAQQ